MVFIPRALFYAGVPVLPAWAGLFPTGGGRARLGIQSVKLRVQGGARYSPPGRFPWLRSCQGVTWWLCFVLGAGRSVAAGVDPRHRGALSPGCVWLVNH
jgi:hypothetical protein